MLGFTAIGVTAIMTLPQSGAVSGGGGWQGGRREPNPINWLELIGERDRRKREEEELLLILALSEV